MHCLYGNTVGFLCTSQIHFCFKNTLKNAIQTNGREKTQTPLLLGMCTPSNTLIPRPTPLTTTNDMQIQLAIFHKSFTGPTDRQTERWARRQVCKKLRICAYAVLH